MRPTDVIESKQCIRCLGSGEEIVVYQSLDYGELKQGVVSLPKIKETRRVRVCELCKGSGVTKKES